MEHNCINYLIGLLKGLNYACKVLNVSFQWMVAVVIKYQFKLELFQFSHLWEGSFIKLPTQKPLLHQTRERMYSNSFPFSNTSECIPHVNTVLG